MSGLVTWQSGDKVPLIIHSTSKAKKTTYHHWRARPTKNVHSKQATWNDTIPHTCASCDAQDDVQDEQCIMFKCTHPQVCNLRQFHTFLLTMSFGSLVTSYGTIFTNASPLFTFSIS
eukprot:1153847-Pelagomonas_calceolata.AAC.1